MSAHSNLNETKAFGCDKIHPKIIKQLVPPVTARLFKLSICWMPTYRQDSMWMEKAQDITIPKNKDLLDISNYRPISLLFIPWVYHFKQNYRFRSSS